MANSIYAPHFQGWTSEIEYLLSLQPRMVKIMDQPNARVVDQLRSVVPDAILWAREYIFEGDLEARIRQNPKQAAEFTLQRLAPYFNAGYDAGSLQNEILVFQEDQLPIIDEYHMHVMDLCPKGKIMVIGHVNVGHPFEPTPQYPLGGYSLLHNSLQKCQDEGHIFSIHAYGRPENFWHKSQWLLSRFEHIFMEGIFHKYPGLLMTYGEIGTSDRLDKVDGQHGGHRWAVDDITMAEWFIQHGEFLNQWSDHLISAHTFTNQAFSPFGKSEMHEVCKIMAETYGNNPQNLKPLVNQPGTPYQFTGEKLDTPLVRTIWRTITDLNFRSSADSSSSDNKIRVLEKHEEVIVLAISGNNPEWFKVQDIKDGVVGYVHSNYIEFVRDIVPVELDTVEQRVDSLETYIALISEQIDANSTSLFQIGDILTSTAGHLTVMEARIAALEQKMGNEGGNDETVNRELSDGFNELNLLIRKNTSASYKLAIGFTTLNGSFETADTNSVFGVNERNRNRILLSHTNPHVYHGAGGDRHVHCAIIDIDGKVIRPLDEDVRVRITYDGHTNGESGSVKILDHKSGFENFPLTNHYFPDQREHGPYRVALVDVQGNLISEEIAGLGLPYKLHVATWLLFQKSN